MTAEENRKRKRAKIIPWPVQQPIDMVNVAATLKRLKQMQASGEKPVVALAPQPTTQADDTVRAEHLRHIIRTLIPQVGRVTRDVMRMSLARRNDIRTSIDPTLDPKGYAKARKLSAGDIKYILDRVWRVGNDAA